MTTHELKTWPEYFEAIVDGRKTFEYRNNDRGFVEGDLVVLREWDPITGEYAGRELTFRVGYVLPVPLNPDHVVFSLLPVVDA